MSKLENFNDSDLAVNINESEEDYNIRIITKSMLVENGEVFATSTQISKYFGIEHKNLLQKIREFHNFDKLVSQLKIKPRNRMVRGKEYPYFELDNEAFLFTCMSIGGKRAETFKWSFIKGFKRLTNELLITKAKAEQNKLNTDWVNSRENLKDVRKNLSKAINLFCEYAESKRGSKYKKCPFYVLITNAIYKYLEINHFIGIRDSLDGRALQMVGLTEFTTKELLEEIIFNDEDYHNIGKKIIKRLEENI